MVPERLARRHALRVAARRPLQWRRKRPGTRSVLFAAPGATAKQPATSGRPPRTCQLAQILACSFHSVFHDERERHHSETRTARRRRPHRCHVPRPDRDRARLVMGTGAGFAIDRQQGYVHAARLRPRSRRRFRHHVLRRRARTSESSRGAALAPAAGDRAPHGRMAGRVGEGRGNRIDHLELRAANAVARSFYKSLGFTESAYIPGYYRGREMALRMMRVLRAPGVALPAWPAPKLPKR